MRIPGSNLIEGEKYTGAFTYQYTPAIFTNKLTTFLVFDQSSLTRNRQLDEFVY